jgi:hypothetical protein
LVIHAILTLYCTTSVHIQGKNPDTLGGNATDTPLAIDVPRVNQSIFNQITYSAVLPNQTHNETRDSVERRQSSRPSSVDWRDKLGAH